jgi:hypothetical protein
MNYHIGLTIITFAFLYLFYAMFYLNKSLNVPKPFLLLYGIGCVFLVIKNIYDRHTYIAINEFIGGAISFLLYFK